jgi:hypothetical protein
MERSYRNSDCQAANAVHPVSPCRSQEERNKAARTILREKF